MPIIGVIDSSKSGNLYSASYESIASGAGNSGGITFSSIPQTYQHLQLRCSLRTVAGGTYDAWFMRFNGDSASGSYMTHFLTGNGSTALAQPNPQANTTAIAGLWMPVASSLTNNYGGVVVDILDYNNSSKFKVVRMLGGFDNNGNGYILESSGLWKNTSAITSIVMGGWSGAIDTNAYWSLYGIKGL